MRNQFIHLVNEQIDYTKAIYHKIHAHPELSYQETETSKLIQKELFEMQIPYQENIAATGVLGVIKGKNPSKKIIALRADMDALPIQEKNTLPHKSQCDNVMHACGHDIHTACLLGAAKVLNQLKDSFEGTILLIFQPGEEKSPGGADLMLKAGVFNEYTPELIIGQHVSVDYFTNEMIFKSGTIMASADEIHITVNGKGGHGALPHLCNDTTLAAAQTLVSLQQIKSRLCPPYIPMILTFGKFIADGATNIIPNKVMLSGTLRTVDETWRAEAKTHIKRIITETCQAYGCQAEIDMPDGYPCVINNDSVTLQAEEFAAEFAGKENIKPMEMRMTSEDFGFFSQKYPSCFYRFGVKKRGTNPGGLHTPNFYIDEDSLFTGMGGLAWIAYRFMQ